GRGNKTRGRGISSPGSSYGYSSSSPVIQRGRMSLINSKISQNEASSSVHLEDIPENTKEDIDDIKSYEKLSKKEMIFLLENSEIQKKEEPWKIFQWYLIIGLYFLGYNTSENVYNFSKMIIKQIISVEDWGISTMKERQISLNKVSMNFTYWTIFMLLIKSSATIMKPIPNWFLNWWSYHGPTTKILPDPFIKLYKKWVKLSPDLNKLYHTNHICYIEKIEQIYFFIEFSIPWIYKWTPEVGFTEEKIAFCIWTRTVGSHLKKDPRILYHSSKGNNCGSSIRHIAQIFFFQDGNKEEIININMEEVKRNFLLNITQYKKSDTFIRSETSDDVAKDIQEAQPCELKKPTSKDTLKNEKPSSTVDTLLINIVGGILPHFSKYLLRCTEEEASVWEVLEFIKLILPLCITGVLEEDLYHDAGYDLPLPVI
ncbi:hypothetical protein H5410_021621, partial [Solanum commersonii]